MKRHPLFLIGILAAFFAASIFITACGNPNDPSKPIIPKEEKPKALQQLTPEKFPKQADGKYYDQYKITWTDAAGTKREKTVTTEQIEKGFILQGGIKVGTTAKITPQVKNSQGTYEDKTDAAKDENPTASTDWNLYVQEGIKELSKEKPDYDKALEQFKNAYGAEQNNTTKTYYAAVLLATISVKPATVNFMRDKMGFETYPQTLNALINTEWFKEYTVTHTYRQSFSVSTALFTQEDGGTYQRVNGHIAATPDASKVSIPISGRSDIYKMGTFGKLAGQWVELGYEALWKTITTTPVKDRENHYSSSDLPDQGKYFVVDACADNGQFMVRSDKVHSMTGAATAKKYTANHQWIDYDYDAAFSYKTPFPKIKEAAGWYKEFPPYLQLPAYIIEHSSSANIDQLIDELYTILFGTEFTQASNILNSLDANKQVTIDKELVKLLHLSGEDGIFSEGTDVTLKKDQILGIIGGMTAAKGCFELVQSYSFNTDLSILKWNWVGRQEDEILKNLGSYNKKQDPFNNGFLKGRSEQKIADAKKDVVQGIDLLLTAYKSLAESDTLPATAKETLKQKAEPIQIIIKEIRDAIVEGRKANLLVGENNPLAKPPVLHDPQQGIPQYTPTYLTMFEIDMGKIFTYEYFKLSKLFEMNGTKPKIYPANAGTTSPYMNMTLKSFMDDFVTIKLSNDRDIFKDQNIPLPGHAGQKIAEFYK